MNCVNCAKRLSVNTLNAKYMGIIGVHECPHCGAVQGSCYKGDSYAIVKPFMAAGEAGFENAFYYDLEVLGSAGVERRHGFADKTTRLIIQVG